MISFTVRGIPAPQGSKRLLPIRGKTGGRLIMVESSKRVPKWRAAVREAAKAARDLQPADRQKPADGPVDVSLDFWLPRPKSHFGSGRNAAVIRPAAPVFPGTKPDVDKLARACLDALTDVLWTDDALVVGLFASKYYATDSRPPGVAVVVTERRDAAKED